MLQFDSEKLRSVYVFIVKVTMDYVYVVSHRNGEEYAPKGSKPVTWDGKTIHRVPIHPTVFAGYKRYSTMTQFSTPRLAALNYYGDTVVSLEAQQYSKALLGFQKADNWQSYFSRSAKALERMVEGQEAYINGLDIYWFTQDTRRMKLSEDGCFCLVNCQVVKIGSLGRPSKAKEAMEAEVKAINSGDDSALKDIDDKFMVRSNEGIILEYQPQEGIRVHSPVLASTPALMAGGSLNGSEEEDREGKAMIRALYTMTGPSPSQANLKLLLKAADVIGEIYGSEHNDFLNVPHVVMATGHTSLYHIPQETQAITPIGRSAVETLAWMMGYIYREKNLYNLRELMRMMRYSLIHGLMPLEQPSPYIPGSEGAEIPLVRYNGSAGVVFTQNAEASA